jgi:branched-chain amino acid transport system substrate-binding protein
MSFIPWCDPTKKLTKQLMGALAKSYPDINMNEKHFYTFEALLIAADAFKRAGGADPKALVDAIRTTILPTTSVWDPVSSSTRRVRTTSSRVGPSRIALANLLSLAPRLNPMLSPSCR